ADLLPVGRDTLVNLVVFGVPGEASAAAERRGGELRGRAVGHAVGLPVIDAVEAAVGPTAQKVALVRPVNEMGPAVARRGRGRDLLDYRAGGDGNGIGIPAHGRVE